MNGGLRYVLDTDTCVSLLRREPRVRARFIQVGVRATAIAIPTVGELYVGAYYSARVEANLARVRAFLSPRGPEILSLDDEAMHCFARSKAELRQRGQLIGDLDLLIAGVALSQGLTLVTNNVGHFSRIPSLLIENWLVV